MARSRVRNTAFMDASRSGSSMATKTIQSFSMTIVEPTLARLARVARVMTTPEDKVNRCLFAAEQIVEPFRDVKVRSEKEAVEDDQDVLK